MTIGDFEIIPGTKPGRVWITNLRSGEAGDFDVEQFRARCGITATNPDGVANIREAAAEVAAFFAEKF